MVRNLLNMYKYILQKIHVLLLLFEMRTQDFNKGVRFSKIYFKMETILLQIYKYIFTL